MKRFALIAAAGAAFAATPAMAQDAGTTIMGNDDAAIGTVISNDGTTVVVDTGAYEAPLPAELIANTDGVYSVNATKAQIDGMMAARVEEQQAAAAAQAQAEAEAAAALDAALVLGAPVITNDAQALGTIDEFAGGNVVVKTADDTLITLPRDFFALDDNGTLMALADLETIMNAVNGG
ncbi:hypothetical protein [Aurantiacibacter gangjinensis]|uniref:Uncharacterized protein n=1 Tax=Aurantiacibacter gangjinensis TaxID=502682 RepID=A0A0G9MR88_9SPHN|nr:hypothetical protein [Aurantiacibacter gangjinensis]APE29180.1 hypothetical protein BMF35_a2351 [Aurantiacibacter gangjinensis]KLE33246.1 hypothetical protein AAW01_04625 [Aurantiacibacter gangjinensis]